MPESGTTRKKAPSALETLASHFESLERREISVPGLDYPLYAPPLNFEQSLALAHANKESSATIQARKYGALITSLLQLEDGKLAFPVKLDEFLSSVPPTVVSTIIEQLFEGLEDHAAELEEKCSKKKSAS